MNIHQSPEVVVMKWLNGPCDCAGNPYQKVSNIFPAHLICHLSVFPLNVHMTISVPLYAPWPPWIGEVYGDGPAAHAAKSLPQSKLAQAKCEQGWLYLFKENIKQSNI